MSWGSNLDNYSPGYCQHVYHAHNHFQHVYAGDREAMTTDPVTGDYFGGAFVDSSGGVELTLRDGIGAADPSNVGGAVSVLDGTGAGQYRRVVHVSNGSRLRLDTAFDTPLDSTSRVQAERCTCDRSIHPSISSPPHPPTHRLLHPRPIDPPTFTTPTGGTLQGPLPLLGEHVRGLWRLPVLRQRRRRRGGAPPLRACRGTSLLGPRHLLRGAHLRTQPTHPIHGEHRRRGQPPVELERLLYRDRDFEPRARCETRPQKVLGTRLTHVRLALGQTRTRTPRRWSRTS